MCALQRRLQNGSQQDFEYFKSQIDQGKFDVRNYPLCRKQTYLQSAIFSGNYDLVKLILEEERKYDLDIDETDWDSDTALMYSTLENYPKITRLLLDNGANPFYLNVDGQNALFYTASTEIVRMLLDEGVNVNHLDVNGETVLCILISEYEELNLEPIALLLKNGARTDIVPPRWKSNSNALTLRELVLSSSIDQRVKDLFNKY